MTQVLAITDFDVQAFEDNALEAKARAAAEAAKLKANRAQLEAEGEARRRRIALREGVAAKRLAARAAERKRRAARIAGFWAVVLIAAFAGTVWYSGDLVAWIGKLATLV